MPPAFRVSGAGGILTPLGYRQKSRMNHINITIADRNVAREKRVETAAAAPDLPRRLTEGAGQRFLGAADGGGAERRWRSPFQREIMWERM
jgi:hypothetical protein